LPSLGRPEPFWFSLVSDDVSGHFLSLTALLNCSSHDIL
jgi:hypothetical protein